MTWTKIFLTLAVALSAILAVSEKTKTPEKNLFYYLQDFPEILELIDKAYVDDVDWSALMPGAFQGILETVDPNASYISAQETNTVETTSIAETYGITVAKRRNYAYVLSVIPGSTAHQAGVRSGDYIRQIAGQSTRRMSLNRIRAVLSQQTDSVALLLASEDDFEDRDVQVTPHTNPIPKIASLPHESGILEVTIQAYYPGIDQDLIELIQAAGPKYASVLLDLRENATRQETFLPLLASLFLPQGLIARTADDSKKKVPLINSREGLCVGKSLYLLMDRSTSGLAELFCAIAQDTRRATLLGESTLGYPFLYQRIQLKNGAQIELPTTRIFLPSGAEYLKKGLKPDFEIQRPQEHGEADLFREQALDYIRNQAEKKAA